MKERNAHRFTWKNGTAGLKSLAVLLLCVLALVSCGKVNTAAEHGTVNGVYVPSITATVTPSATPDPGLFSPSPMEPAVPDEPSPTGQGIVEGTPSPTSAGIVEGPPVTPASDRPDQKKYSRSGRTDVPDFIGLAYIVTDFSGNTLISYDASRTIYPASTIKMLTALTAIEYMNLSNILTVDANVMSVIPEDEWNYGVVEGMSFPLSVWMHMLMMESCGDAAFTIAYNVGKVIDGDMDPVEAFVEGMNRMAASLGLTGTHVDNPVGLDIGNGYGDIYSTPSDIAKLTLAYMNNEALAEFVSKKEYTVPDCTLPDGTVAEGRELHCTNFFYTEPEKYNSPLFTSIGTKSGQTNAAGNCYAATVVTESGKKLICCVFGVGAPETDDKVSDRGTMFNEIIRLLEYTIKNEIQSF